MNDTCLDRLRGVLLRIYFLVVGEAEVKVFEQSRKISPTMIRHSRFYLAVNCSGGRSTLGFSYLSELDLVTMMLA